MRRAARARVVRDAHPAGVIRAAVLPVPCVSGVGRLVQVVLNFGPSLGRSEGQFSTEVWEFGRDSEMVWGLDEVGR